MERPFAKPDTMFEAIGTQPARHKVAKLLEESQRSQEKLQGYRSQVSYINASLLKYRELDQRCTKYLANLPPRRSGEPKAVSVSQKQVKAVTSIAKYEDILGHLQGKIGRHQERLNKIEKWFNSFRRKVATGSHPGAQVTIKDPDTLVTNIGFRIAIQKVSAPKERPEEVCSCCQDPIDFRAGDACMLDCLHGYHISCVSEWLEKAGNCPNCQQTTQTLFEFTNPEGDLQPPKRSIIQKSNISIKQLFGEEDLGETAATDANTKLEANLGIKAL